MTPSPTPQQDSGELDAILDELMVNVKAETGYGQYRRQAKQEIQRLITKEAARLAGEVIGEDSSPDYYDPDFVDASDVEDIKLEAQNELRAEQRQRLAAIDKELEALGGNDE